MEIKSARFMKSSTDIGQCPSAFLPEYAFIGRSNVGKSSLINMITGAEELAKTSSKPGKTQFINHFILNEKWYLVDLPGYGFAHASHASISLWEMIIKKYLTKRKNLLSTFVLVDSRLVPQKNDIDFMHWLASKKLPFVIIFTKIDKLPSGRLEQHVQHYKDVMLKTWHELPPMIFTSRETKAGKKEILDYIEKTNKLFKPEMSKNPALV